MVADGASFIGLHSCERHVGNGDDVLCVDNYFTDSKQNIAHLVDHPNFEIARFDVREHFQVEVDDIYNLACPASPKYFDSLLAEAKVA